MDFNEWWARQPKDPTKPITPRMAWDAAIAEELKACAKVCGDRAKAASIAGDTGAYYEAEECEDAILARSNV